MIPCTHNHAGFPDGISGKELIARMKEQAQLYGTRIEEDRVTRLDCEGELFTAEWGSGSAIARTVLLATGVTNRRPPMDEELHDDALARGLIRYCPICDGYEVTDKKVGVIGSDCHGVAEALFLRGFTRDVTLIAPHAELDLPPRTMTSSRLRVSAWSTARPRRSRSRTNASSSTPPKGHFTFDSIYPALGSDTHTQLAEMVGARLGDDGCIGVDAHQRTSVPGVYAAGDVVIGLDQISHAMGEGGVAATTIRNDLAKDQPLLR